MLHAISTPTPTAQASTLFPSWLALISLLQARLSLSIPLPFPRQQLHLLARRLYPPSSPAGPWSRNCCFLPIFLPPALAGEGEWCEEAGAAVVTGASELRAEVFKQGRAPGEAMTALFLSLQSPLLGLDGNSWSHLRPNGSGLQAALPHQIPLPTPPADIYLINLYFFSNIFI